MIKNLIIVVLFIGLILTLAFEDSAVEPKQNQMVDGCVNQKSGDQWIRTCG